MYTFKIRSTKFIIYSTSEDLFSEEEGLWETKNNVLGLATEDAGKR